MGTKYYEYFEWQKTSSRYNVYLLILIFTTISTPLGSLQPIKTQIPYSISSHLYLPSLISQKNSENHIFEISAWSLLTKGEGGKVGDGGFVFLLADLYLVCFYSHFNEISGEERNSCIQSKTFNRKSHGYLHIGFYSWLTLCTDVSNKKLQGLG